MRVLHWTAPAILSIVLYSALPHKEVIVVAAGVGVGAGTGAWAEPLLLDTDFAHPLSIALRTTQNTYVCHCLPKLSIHALK